MALRQGENRFLGADIDPDLYMVGPGDKFSIYFVSSEIDNIECEINSSGVLFVKSVGLVELGQISLTQAKEKIREVTAKYYSGTMFGIELSNYRFFGITVMGAVNKPGIYYVPAVWRVSEVIELAGGLAPAASKRRIVLRDINAGLPVDLVRFNKLGDKDANPLVCRGNAIEVPTRSSLDEIVSLTGLVNRPGTFEVINGDILGDYLNYADDPKGKLEDMEIIVFSGSGSETNRLDGSSPQTHAYKPNPGDNIKLIWKAGREAFGSVLIFGAVERPGRYPVSHNPFSLKDLLELCGGIESGGYSHMIQIYRTSWDKSVNGGHYNLMSPPEIRETLVAGLSGINIENRANMISYNPRNPIDHSEMILRDGDSVFVPFATGMVSVTGAVVSPGLVRYRDGQSVDYYIAQAGGFGYDADRDRIVVINSITGGRIDASSAGGLFDSEILFVPRKENGLRP
jgi:protein involved in polysaccharide export with SLBB domain